jgi:hypothetical protein
MADEEMSVSECADRGGGGEYQGHPARAGVALHQRRPGKGPIRAICLIHFPLDISISFATVWHM